MADKGLTSVPGFAPPAPVVDHQHPFKAFYVCQVSIAIADCEFEGQNEFV
jgi:hypothetical protein